MAEIISLNDKLEQNLEEQKKESEKRQKEADDFFREMQSYKPSQDELDRDAERIFDMREHPEKYEEMLLKMFYRYDLFRRYVSFFLSENNHRISQVADFIIMQTFQIEQETGTDLSVEGRHKGE